MRLHAIISGRVQGVGFRYFAVETARSLDLKGYVRNLANGGLEVVAEGDQASLEAFVKRLQRGPAAARITNVQISYGPATEDFVSFEVRATSR